MEVETIVRCVSIGAVTAGASVEDLRRRRIPDPLVGAGLIVTLLLSRSIGETIIGGLAGLSVFMAVRIMSGNRLGLGDVKLSAYLGSSLGCRQWWTAAVTASVAALLFVLVRATRGRPRADLALPFAPFLAFGCLLSDVMLYTNIPLWEVPG